jgi:hypothetical protein
MCRFCDNIIDKTKEIIWNVRSTYADDNICEFVNGNDCGSCDKCEMYFKLDSYELNGNINVGMQYNQKITTPDGKDVIIRPFSEMLQFNYCPFCGKQISKDIQNNEADNEYYVEIINKEN